ncbi:hypothetical protein [Methylococcus capsulatus]|uniref:hypothetical protein n=1 Tax=Methylococcus capsulatus TaxID=414 RepID=UPI001C528BD2|nr:hypothetical protein [Methylococcus capsulatus]QXP89531.1 hypothetical protein KW114_10465 [Methylococcus capsulatus]
MIDEKDKDKDKEQGIRIQMVIAEEVCPELYAELAAIPSRYRAERLRLLATVGWLSIRRTAEPPPAEKQGAPGDAGPPARDAAARITRRFERLENDDW